MKIKFFILLTVYLYKINNYSKSSNNESAYYFYKKLSDISINKDTTLEEILEQLKTATQQTAQEIDDIDFIEKKNQLLNNLSSMITANQIKTITWRNIALFLEEVGVEYQKNNNFKNWQNNIRSTKNIQRKTINYQYFRFHRKLQANGIKDNIKLSRLKNLFCGIKIATIGSNQDTPEAIPIDKMTHSFENIKLIGIVLITLFRGINRARDSFDNNKNYTPREGDDEYFDCLKLYELL